MTFIYIAISFVIYWSVRLSTKRRRDGVNGGKWTCHKIWCKIQIIINYSYEVATLIKMRNPWPLKIEASCLSKEYQTYLDPFEL